MPFSPRPQRDFSNASPNGAGNTPSNAAAKAFTQAPPNQTRRQSARGHEHLHMGIGQQSPAPMSAARAAAEAAFAAPNPGLADKTEAQITVRRARALAPAALPEPQHQADQPAAPTQKGPRVFRIDTAPAAPLAQAAPAAALQSGWAAERPPVSTKRRRRLSVDKQPGAVVLLVHNPSVQRPAEGSPEGPSLRVLADRLAEITPILADIERAQSFWFIDPACGRAEPRRPNKRQSKR